MGFPRADWCASFEAVDGLALGRIHLLRHQVCRNRRNVKLWETRV